MAKDDPTEKPERLLPPAFSNVYYSQAERVIDRFGGVEGLVELLDELMWCITTTEIISWTKPISEGGTGGLIPLNVMRAVLQAARYEGLLLSSEDLDPRANPVPAIKLKYTEAISKKDELYMKKKKAFQKSKVAKEQQRAYFKRYMAAKSEAEKAAVRRRKRKLEGSDSGSKFADMDLDLL